MERVTIGAPAMFADHHVLKVRQVLLGLEGVEEVYASAAWQTVLVSYDESKTKPAAIAREVRRQIPGLRAFITTPPSLPRQALRHRARRGARCERGSRILPYPSAGF